MKWILIEPIQNNQLGYIFGEVISAVLFFPDDGRVFVSSKGADLIAWPANAARGWCEVRFDNVIGMFKSETITLSRLAALVKYGVTDEFVNKLTMSPRSAVD